MPAMSDGDEYGFSAAKLREILESRAFARSDNPSGRRMVPNGAS